MRTERFILCNIMGWKVVTDFPEVDKSVMAFAPHTSYWDTVLGKLVLRIYGIPHRLLSKKELFHFPMNVVMRLLGGVPVGGVKGHNAIHDAVGMLNKSDKIHLLICPEGQLAPTDRWNPGFYYMAVKTGVPIVVVFLDYGKKEAGVKGVIYNPGSIDDVYRQLAEMYRGVTARYPDRFLLPKTRRES